MREDTARSASRILFSGLLKGGMEKEEEWSLRMVAIWNWRCTWPRPGGAHDVAVLRLPVRG
eukprot:12932913-Prorocentrum_lima.AAC.1